MRYSTINDGCVGISQQNRHHGSPKILENGGKRALASLRRHKYQQQSLHNRYRQAANANFRVAFPHKSVCNRGIPDIERGHAWAPTPSRTRPPQAVPSIETAQCALWKHSEQSDRRPHHRCAPSAPWFPGVPEQRCPHPHQDLKAESQTHRCSSSSWIPHCAHWHSYLPS